MFVVSPFPAEPDLLSVHASCLWRAFALTATLKSTQEAGCRVRDIWVWNTVHRGCHWVRWYLRVMFSPQLIGRLSEFQIAVSRSPVLLMPSETLICLFPHLFHPSSHGAPRFILWMLWKRNESFWQGPVQLGNPSIHKFSLPLPQGRNQWTSWLALSCAVLGKKWCWQSQTVSLTHSNACKLFFPAECCNFFFGKPRLPQRLTPP